ncbi:MAG: hypothetical protein K0V04_09890, partial [Deltaproteobacteria bacterium]|nr:hypothetical protein [Deltaproteobacteria bacterium]
PSPEPRLPYGGSLYELEVDEIVGVLDRDGWTALRKGALAAPRKAATRAARAGRPTEFREQLQRYIEAFDAALPGAAGLMSARREAAQLHDAAVARVLEESADAMAVGVWCDDVSQDVSWPGWEEGPLNPDMEGLLTALETCAEQRLQDALDRGDIHAVTAGERLMKLLGRRAFRTPGTKQSRRLQRRIETIRRRLKLPDTDRGQWLP